MFKDAKVVESEGMLDVEVLERYVTDNLNGIIGEEYKDVVNRITFTDGYENADNENEAVTRAEAIAALWIMEGSPASDFAMRFDDVSSETPYAEAIRWATAVKIVNGCSESSFAPDDVLTREQLAAIMWRYAKNENADVSIGESTNILSYEDVFSVSGYAIEAFQWTCGSGIMPGNTISTLAPNESVSRIYFASVLHRYLQSIKN